MPGDDAIDPDGLSARRGRRGPRGSDTDVVLAMNEFHVLVGQDLARHWSLPQPVVDSIECYRDYRAALAFQKTAMMVHLASQLASFLVCSEEPATKEDVEDVVRLRVSQDLGLSLDHVESLLKQSWRIRDIVESML